MKRTKKIRMMVLCIILMLIPSLSSKATSEEMDSFTYIVNSEGEAVITGGNRTEKEVNIPNVINGFPVVGIAEGAFRDRGEIEKVVIQSGVRYIGAFAFAGCIALEEVELGDGLQYIAENAFCNAFRLRVAILPESIVYVGEKAFGNCTQLAQIEFPQTAHVDGYAFEGALWQEERDKGKFRIRGSLLIEGRRNEVPVLEIPYGVTEIDGCSWLGLAVINQYYDTEYEQIILPNTLVKLGNCCFQRVSVEMISIPTGVKEIPKCAFEYSELEEIELPMGLKSIRQASFCYSELKTINIPDSVELIEENAFRGTSLSKVTIPSSVRSIGRMAFAQCDNLTEIVFEEGMTKAEADMFAYCKSLERVQFPESLESLEGEMFNPGTKRVYIPKGTVLINDDIFKSYIRYEMSIVVYGQSGSRAQEVAEAAGMKFVEVENGNEMP